MQAAAGRPGDGEEFSKAELLAMERDMLGMFISDHPLTHVQDALARRVTTTVAQLSEMHDRSEIVIGGLIASLKRTTTKAGSAMAFATIEDLTGSVEVIVFPKTYEEAHLTLKRDAVVIVRGRLDVADQQVKVLAEGVTLLEPLPAPASVSPAPFPPVPARDVTLHVLLDADRHGEDGLVRLHELLGRYRGDRPVVLTIRSDGRDVKMQPGDLRVTSGPAVVQEIEGLLGPSTASWILPARG
jgi:DNA polymerase-3 subunit alpha